MWASMAVNLYVVIVICFSYIDVYCMSRSMSTYDDCSNAMSTLDGAFEHGSILLCYMRPIPTKLDGGPRHNMIGSLEQMTQKCSNTPY